MQSHSEKSVYIFSSDRSSKCNDLLPSNLMRSSRIRSLIKSCFQSQNLHFIDFKPATFNDLKVFHDSDFLKCLESDGHARNREEYGLGFDCCPFKGLAKHVSMVAGGTIGAAEKLISASGAPVAVHWDGGRHHAGSDYASGFCYVNDIVLGIFKLQERFSRVLYIDIDAHHGDGVEFALDSCSNAITCSFHIAAPGFFPNSGHHMAANTYNFPISPESFDSSKYIEQFTSTVSYLISEHDVDAIVFQMGADLMRGDPLVYKQLGNCNVTLPSNFGLDMPSYGILLKHVLSKNIPVLLLGGGGYHTTNVPILYAYLTSICLGCEADFLRQAVPEHEYWSEYAYLCDYTFEEIITRSCYS